MLRLAPSLEESKRLQALRRYKILDTEAEHEFDRITRLATDWLDVPIAVISFVDERRQWFKSCVGLPHRETSREVSFCTQNLYRSSLMVIEDTTADPRFADNIFVTGAPGVRFYAGAPLCTPDGHVLGFLCVMDTRPRSATAMPLDLLLDLADIVVSQLELRLKNRTLDECHQRVQALTQELKQAEEANRSTLSRLLQEDLKQTLQATRMQLENACTTEGLPARHVQRLERVLASLDEAVGLTGTLSTRFAPPVENQPLSDTLAWLTTKMNEVHNLSVSFSGRGALLPISEDCKVVLYQIVREILFRIAGCPDAHNAHIDLQVHDDDLHLAIETSGNAFDPTSEHIRRHCNMEQVQNRLNGIGGHLQLQMRPDTGPRIFIRMPMQTG